MRDIHIINDIALRVAVYMQYMIYWTVDVRQMSFATIMCLDDT